MINNASRFEWWRAHGDFVVFCWWSNWACWWRKHCSAAGDLALDLQIEVLFTWAVGVNLSVALVRLYLRKVKRGNVSVYLWQCNTWQKWQYHIISYDGLLLHSGVKCSTNLPKTVDTAHVQSVMTFFLGVVCCQYDISSNMQSTHCCDVMCIGSYANQHQESTPRLARSVTSALVTVAPLAISQLTAAVLSKSRACHLGLCIPKNWTNHNSTSSKNHELGDSLLLNCVAGWCHLT